MDTNVMPSAYIALSFAQRAALADVIDTIETVLEEQQIHPLVFVRKYHFEPEEATAMMQTALADIQRCDWLIAELTYKAVGVGLEVGYAKGIGKPIIYVRQADAEPSTTISGVADHIIVYTTTADLAAQLATLMRNYF